MARAQTFLLIIAFFLFGGCASIATHTPVPETSADIVRPMGLDNLRYWGDEAPPDVAYRARESIALMKARPDSAENPLEPIGISLLAISGGGENGAFGAGFLTGWSETGARPQFQAVTGVSTGALIAPFAFLGADYDSTLEAAYTETTPDDIYALPFIPDVLHGQSLARSDPLVSLIETFITPDVLDAIALEHRKGRRLSILTTNLDAGRPVVWDMGAIAELGGPEALRLFRKVVLASAAVPGLLPPVEITVISDDAIYTELHGDGSIIANVFAYQPQVELGTLLKDAGLDLDITLYVILNGKRNVDYEPPRMVWYDLTMRSIYLLLSSSTNSQIAQIYATAERDGLDFRLATIPLDYPHRADELFDQDFMRGLFAFGKQQAEDGYKWADKPLQTGTRKQ